MKKLLLFLLCSGTASAQNITIWPTTTASSPAQIPIYGTKGCSTIINGQNDPRVTWSVSPSSGATLITNPTPLMTNPQEAALYSTSTGTYTLTATSVAGGLTASCVIKFIGAPTVTSGHPRFYAKPSTIAALQAKGISGNANYANGLQTLANTYVSEYAPYFDTWSTWNGTSCTIGSGPNRNLSGFDIELAAYYVSMAALFDSSSTNRNTYGCEARDLFMALTNYVESGAINLELQGGRWADGAGVYGWTTPYDNLRAGGYLSSSDITAIRNFFLSFAISLVHNPFGNGISPSPTATYNDPSLFHGSGTGTSYPDSSWTREAGNNYTHARIIIAAVLALSFDDNTTEDPLVATGTVLSMLPGTTNSTPPMGSGTGFRVGDQFSVAGGLTGQVTYSDLVSGINIITPGSGFPASTNVTFLATATSGGQHVYVTVATNSSGVPTSAAVADGGNNWNVGQQFNGINGFVGQVASIDTSVLGMEVLTPSTGYNNSGTALAATATSGSGTGLTVIPTAGNTCGTASRYTLCSDSSGGSLHAYWNWVAGTLLYLDWATMEDATVAQTSLNAAFGNMSSAPTCSTGMGSTPTMPCLGINQGGESVEGLLYGGSVDKLLWGLNFIHNAGYDDPHLWGPQMSLEDSSFWDLRYVADATALVSLNPVPPSLTGEAGPGGWDFLSAGDSLSNYTYPSYLAQDAALMAYDSYLPTPRTDRTNALEWIVLNSAFGMAAGTSGTCSTHGLYCGILNELGNDYGKVAAPGMFVALPSGNPVTPTPPTDPRPNFPTDWYDIGNKHLVLRDNWTTSDTIFDFLATDTQIDHEHQYDGRFEVNSHGYWLTKGRQIFNNYNTNVTVSQYENQVSLPNSTGSWSSWQQSIFGPTTVLGGQFWHGNQAGLTPFAYSALPSYAAMHVDNTNAYNGGAGTFATYNDVTAASREVIYNRSSAQVAVYDRAAVGHAATTQTSTFNTTGAVTFTGSQGCWNDQSGTQKACLTSVYPSGATITATALYNSFSYTVPNLNLQNGTTMQVGNCVANYADGTTQNCLTYPDQLQGQVAQWAIYTPNTSTACPYATISSSGLITAAATGTGPCQVTGGYTFSYWGEPANVVFNVISGASGGGPVSSKSNGQPTGESGSDWQPEYYLQIKPSGTPTSTNFGSVMQWGTSSLIPLSATAIASSSGQTYDGMLVGTTAYWFMRSLATFTGVTVPASSATTHYFANLTPNTSYTISGTGAPTSATTDNAGVLTFAASGTGNITVGASVPPAVTSISGAALSGAVVQ